MRKGELARMLVHRGGGIFALILLAMVASVLPAQGQYPPEIAAGRRVRFDAEAPALGRTTARIVEIHPQWLSYQQEGDTVVHTRRLATIDTLLVSQGRDRGRSAWWGAAWGTYLGSSSSMIAGVLTARSLHRGVGESVALGAVVGTLVGAPLGAAIGAILAPERWRAYRFSRTPLE